VSDIICYYTYLYVKVNVKIMWICIATGRETCKAVRPSCETSKAVRHGSHRFTRVTIILSMVLIDTVQFCWSGK